jgi:AcrR family transcriptional regulator
LEAATRLSTVEGLDGLSLGRLAQETGMSKSLFAHFGSKEELQLAAIAAADEVFRAEVLEPALAEREGLPRLRALCERFLEHVERGVFPGRCFFASAAAELDTQPGPLRDRVAEVYEGWMALIEGCIRRAQALAQLERSIDPEQLAFEINAMLAEANGLFLLRADPRAFEMARRAIRGRLSSGTSSATATR